MHKVRKDVGTQNACKSPSRRRQPRNSSRFHSFPNRPLIKQKRWRHQNLRPKNTWDTFQRTWNNLRSWWNSNKFVGKTFFCFMSGHLISIRESFEIGTICPYFNGWRLNFATTKYKSLSIWILKGWPVTVSPVPFPSQAAWQHQIQMKKYQQRVSRIIKKACGLNQPDDHRCKATFLFSILFQTYSQFAWIVYRKTHTKKVQAISQTAAGPGVGAIEEESQDANGRSARQETNGDQRKPWRFATCRGHAHLHGTALSESGGLCQGSSLMLRAATQHLRSCEALTWQQHVGGACHHSQHQQVGATCHLSDLELEQVVSSVLFWAWTPSSTRISHEV